MGAEVLRVAVRTLGCKVNRTESEALAERLLAAAVSVTEDAVGADLVVVNTCTVTGEADAKARKEVRRALQACRGPVVVTGCMAAVDAEGLRSLDPRVIVEADRSALLERVAGLLGVEAPRSHAPRAGAAFRTRVMVKVQDGCDHRCSYCIVPDARGAPRSEPAADVRARVAQLVADSTTEVVLTGVNIGRYADAAHAEDLPALIEQIAATGVSRIRISSIEPLDLTERFLQTLTSTPAVVRHLHVPLQSGSDATLRAMRRGYTSDEYAELLRRAHAALPGLAVTTDVMVGFPGESDADFRESIAFVERCAFARLHVFRYSRRAGTPAATMTDQVAPETKRSRAEAMRALSLRLAHAHTLRLVGSEVDVCVERAEAGAAWGMSDAGVRVDLAEGGLRQGEVVRVRVTSADDGRVRGRCAPVVSSSVLDPTIAHGE